MAGAVLTAVGYPLFLLALLCVLLWIFSADAIPAFAEVKPMESWTGMAASMGILANSVRLGLLPFLWFCAVLAAVVTWSLPRWNGHWRLKVDDLPPWSLYRLIQGAGFLGSLAAFLRAGVPLPEALRRIRLSANPWLAERIDATLFYVHSGYDLGEALHLAGHRFPARDIVEDLRIYASLGNLEDSMERITAEWIGQSLADLKALGDALKVLGMILVAATIAWVQIGIISVQQQLTSIF
jgi:type II secretory pathway component PulF